MRDSCRPFLHAAQCIICWSLGCASLSAGIEVEVGLTADHRDSAALKSSPVNSSSKFRDPVDGCFDLSQVIEHPMGFIPMVVPITEPAVGYGALGSLIFISENQASSDELKVKPNITAIGGLRTENDTEGYFAMHSGHWSDGKIQTLAVIADVSVNLDFYGLGSRRIEYTIDSEFLNLETKYRLGDSRSMLGVSYTHGDVRTRFAHDLLPGNIELGNKESRLRGLGILYSYDTRDNYFTPNSGCFIDGSVIFHDPSWGASYSFQKASISAFHYTQLNEVLVLGVRCSAEAAFGHVPFYQLPYVSLRGVPAMRYQGETIGFCEAELRWKFRNRLSLIGFAGAGVTRSQLKDIDLSDEVVAAGLGIRYEIARQQGLHMGLDLGISDEDVAVYVVFGSAWMRP